MLKNVFLRIILIDTKSGSYQQIIVLEFIKVYDDVVFVCIRIYGNRVMFDYFLSTDIH